MAIGLEFETDVTVTGDVEYQKVVYQAANMPWKILLDGVEGDTAVLEFVTEAFGGLAAIEAALGQISEFIELVVQQYAAQNLAFSNIINGLAQIDAKWATQVAPYNGTLTVREQDFAAAPQVTLDIPFAQVNSFLQFAQGMPVGVMWLALREKIITDLRNEYRPQIAPNKQMWDDAEAKLAALEQLKNQLTNEEYQKRKKAFKAQRQTARDECARLYQQRDEAYLEMQELSWTGGIKMEGLRRYYYGYKLFVDPKVLFPGVDIKNSVARAQTWVQEKKAHHGNAIPDNEYDKACSLMTLLLLYLNSGFAVSSPQAYSKEFFTVMSRTCFSAMYANMNQGMQLITRDEVLNTAWEGTPEQQNGYVLTKGFRESRIRIGDQTYQVVEGPDGKVAYGPRRGDWIASIIAPLAANAAQNTNSGLQYVSGVNQTRFATVAQCDAASATANPNRNFHFTEKDLMSRSDPVYSSVSLGYNRHLGNGDTVALEFRQWPNVSLPVTDWWGFASYIFDSSESFFQGN